jgi:hypothetical protein
LDLSKLKPSDWLIGGGAIVFLISMFLPWYGISESGVDVSDTGFEYFLTGIIPFLLIAATFVVLVLPVLVESVNVPDPIGPVPKAQAALGAAGVAAVLVILRVVIKSDNINGIDLSGFGIGDAVGRKFGLYIALLAAIAVAAGAFMKFQEGDSTSSEGSGPATPF